MAQDVFPEDKPSKGSLMKDYENLPARDEFYANPAKDDVEAQARAKHGHQRQHTDEFTNYDDPADDEVREVGWTDGETEKGKVNDETVQEEAKLAVADVDDGVDEYYVDPAPEQEKLLGPEVTIYESDGMGDFEKVERSDRQDEQGVSEYDPSAHTVASVREYIREHPDQEDAVLEDERRGEARKTLVG